MSEPAPKDYIKRNLEFAPNLSSDGTTMYLSVPVTIGGTQSFDLRIELDPHEVAFMVSQGAKCLASKLSHF